ncbi:hypothetical protein PG993_005735 [Apiospora rasikravindrae]|uniref:Uncharacterized protein n=1 Tax=Apiospora rasikravindrae TaxID=990691 RepID=A0ABR1T9M2_9PEZI
MSDEQHPASGALPQMPLDLSVYENEQDYLNAARCNFILQRALKSKDDIAAKGNANIAKLVTDVRRNIHQELANIGKLQADEIAQAKKDLQDLGRSQPEIERAQAYLTGHLEPIGARHEKNPRNGEWLRGRGHFPARNSSHA